jgi:hypothetical protein
MRSLVRVAAHGGLALSCGLALIGCGTGRSSSTGTTSPIFGSTAPAASGAAAKRNADLCRRIADSYNRALGHSGGAAGQPLALRRSREAMRRESEAVLALAPGRIKPDLLIIFGAAWRFTDALAKVNYDPVKLPPDATLPFETPAFEAASTRTFTFVSQRCPARRGTVSAGTSSRTNGSPVTAP